MNDLTIKLSAQIVRGFPASLRLRKIAKGSRDPTSFTRRPFGSHPRKAPLESGHTARSARLSRANIIMPRFCQKWQRSPCPCRVPHLPVRRFLALPRNSTKLFIQHIASEKRGALRAASRVFRRSLSPVLQTLLQLLDDCRRKIVDRCRVRTGGKLSYAGHGVNFHLRNGTLDTASLFFSPFFSLSLSLSVCLVLDRIWTRALSRILYCSRRLRALLLLPANARARRRRREMCTARWSGSEWPPLSDP